MLFAVVMSYKVATDTELVNSEPSLLGEIQGSCESLLTIFSSINQYITLFYVCFCLTTVYYIVWIH